MNSFVYEYLSSEIYDEYKKIFSFKKSLIKLWEKDKGVLIYFSITIISYFSACVIFIQTKFVGWSKYVLILGALSIFLVSFSIFIKKANSLTFLDYINHTTMLRKVEDILEKYGINLIETKHLENLLNENNNMIGVFLKKINSIFDKIFKLVKLLIIIPIGFLLTLGFNTEKDNLGENISAFMDNIFMLIPNILIIGIIVVSVITYMLVSFMDNDFINFIFPSQNKAYVFNKYVRAFLYDTVFTNSKLTNKKII